MTQTLLNNRYRLVRAIGSGGFGETFLAEDTQMPSGRRCVIKQLKPIINNPQVYQLVQERFQREAVILEELGEGSNQIPKLYAYFPINGQFYLVQEWVEGATLTAKVQMQGRLEESFVRDILANLLLILDYVHSKRMVHRDIKPDNIILRQRDGKPVLLDFGAVKETMGTVINTQGYSTSSIVIGTPGFIPSEQAAGRPVYSSDLYSLGLTAIYLLTGKVPQALDIDPGTGEILWHRHALSVSSSLANVLDKAIQSHSRDRYQTAREMLDALQSAYTPIPPTLPVQNRPIISQSATEKSSQTATLSTSSSNIASGEKGVIVGSLIAGGLIAISIIIGFLLAKISQPALQQTATEKSTRKSVEIPLNNESKPSSPISNRPRVKPLLPTQTESNNNSQIIISEDNNFSWLSYRKVTSNDLVGKGAFELDIMRNSIFARHGRMFNSAELQNYFNRQTWYRPIYSPDKFPNSLLSTLEKQNAAYILEYQNRNGLRWVR